MQIPSRRAVRLELVPREAIESFAARDFRLPHFEFRWHRHPELELTLILQGSGTRFVADSIEPFAAGDLCFLGPDIPHSWYSEQAPRAVRSLVIQFLPDFWGKDFSRLPEIQRLSKTMARCGGGLNFGGTTRQRVALEMAELFKSPRGSAARLAKLITILGVIGENIGSDDTRALSRLGPSTQRKVDRSGVIARTLQILGPGIAHAPSESRMAAAMGMKPAAFSRRFKYHMGKTYVQYVMDWRMSFVCRRLAETEQSITEIAFEAGFANLSNFNRRFKQAKGITPREFRRMAGVGSGN